MMILVLGYNLKYENISWSTMKQKTVSFQSNDRKIVGYLSYPDNKKNKEGKNCPAIIVTHGYCGDKESAKGQLLVDQFGEDFVILRIDFNGHGDSEGNFEELTITKCVEDLQNAISYLETLEFVNKDQIGIMGFSMGGMTSIIAAAKDKRIKAGVLFSAPSHFEHCDTSGMHKYDNATWKQKGVNYLLDIGGEFKVKINYSFFEDGCSYDMYELAKKIKIPLVIFHGDHDDIVPLKQSQELIKHLENGNLRIIEGADHRYNQDLDLLKELIGESGEFFKTNLKNE